MTHWQATLNTTDGTGQSRVTHGSSMSDINPTHTASNADLPAVVNNAGGIVSMVCTEQRPLLAGDVKVTIHGAKGKMAAFWFHTAFIEGGKLRLSKGELDKACKEKKLYRDDFGVEVCGCEGRTGRAGRRACSGREPLIAAYCVRLLRASVAGVICAARGGVEGELQDTIRFDALDWLPPMSSGPHPSFPRAIAAELAFRDAPEPLLRAGRPTNARARPIRKHAKTHHRCFASHKRLAANSPPPIHTMHAMLALAHHVATAKPGTCWTPQACWIPHRAHTHTRIWA